MSQTAQTVQCYWLIPCCNKPVRNSFLASALMQGVNLPPVIMAFHMTALVWGYLLHCKLSSQQMHLRKQQKMDQVLGSLPSGDTDKSFMLLALAWLISGQWTHEGKGEGEERVEKRERKCKRKRNRMELLLVEVAKQNRHNYLKVPLQTNQPNKQKNPPLSSTIYHKRKQQHNIHAPTPAR